MAQPASSRSTARLSRPQTAASSSSLSSARLTGPQHFRYHSKDDRHHWSVDVAETKSFLPSPPFELSVAFPPAAASQVSQRSTAASPAHRLSSPTATSQSSPSSSSSSSHSLPARQQASYISHLQRHRHLHSDVLRSSCGLRTSVLPFMQQRTDRQNDDERTERRRRRAAASGGEEPTLLSRSTSSVERVYTAMRASRQHAERAVKERTETERKRREEEEEQRRRCTDAIAGEQEQDAASDYSIPAGFYYAKQFDFFSTVRQKTDKQRKERDQQDREAVASEAAAGDAAAAAAARTEEEQKHQTARRANAEPLIAKGRKSDWLVDGWWEAKKHFQALRHTQDVGISAQQLQRPYTAPAVSPPELLVPFPASVTASSSSAASLFSAAERPPLTYEPVTPLWLSSRPDYARLQSDMLTTLALNALHKQPQSRSTLEQRMLSVWTQRLPLFDRGETGGGAELLAVSLLVKKQAGDVLYTEGDIGTCMFVLLEGTVTLQSAAAAASPASPAAARRRHDAAAAADRLTRANTLATGRESRKDALTAAQPLLRPATAGAAFVSAVSQQRPQHSHSASAVAVVSPASSGRLVHPFTLLGARRSDLRAETVSASQPAGRCWSLLRQLLSLSHKFQFSNISRLADNRQRLDTASCSAPAVSLLCLSYSDYDRIVRQWAERQSRQTLTLFRGVDLFSRLKIRALHRLGKAITVRQYAARDWLTSSSAESSADFCFFLCSGTVKLYKSTHLISYHRELGHWQREKLHRRVGVDFCSGPAMLGAEALLGVQHYDTHFRAVSDCQVFVLRRRDFHLLMQPQTLVAVEKRVAAQREKIPMQALKAIETEEKAKAEMARKSPRPIQVRVEMTANDGDLTVGRNVCSTAKTEDSNAAIHGSLNRAEVESVQVVMNFSAFLSL